MIGESDSEAYKTGNIHVCPGLGGAPVTQDHNQKLLPPLASFILLPALIEGEMPRQSHTEQNTLAQTH